MIFYLNSHISSLFIIIIKYPDNYRIRRIPWK